jgi:hypothetical protein
MKRLKAKAEGSKPNPALAFAFCLSLFRRIQANSDLPTLVW